MKNGKNSTKKQTTKTANIFPFYLKMWL